MKARQLILLALLQLSFTSFAQNLQWAFNIGASGDDWGANVTTDVAGNIYVTGDFWGTVDFDQGSGVETLTSNGQADIFVAKYSPSGAYLWAINMGGTYSDRGKDIAIDSDGNIYLTGFFEDNADFDPGPGTTTLLSGGNWDRDIFVAKYDSSGNYQWAFNVGSGLLDMGYGIVLDGAGYLYVAGSFVSTADFDPSNGVFNLTSAGNDDLFVAKYDVSGNYIWAYNMGVSSWDVAYAITFDANSIYLTGAFQDTVDFDPGPGTSNLISTGDYDAYIAKYDTACNYEWAINVGGIGDDRSYSIDMDNSGNVYITGFFEDTADFDGGPGTKTIISEGGRDIFVAKYNSAGDHLWSIGAGGILDDYSFSIATDAAGDVYTTGYFRDTADFDPGPAVNNLYSAGNQDIFLAKYNTAGSYQWAFSMGASLYDFGNSINIDPFGGILVTGFFQDSADFDPSSGTSNLMGAGNADVFIAKYNETSTGIIMQPFYDPILNVYPNPFSTLAFIEVPKELINSKLLLYDTFGRLIRTIELTGRKAIITKGNLAAGLYYYQVVNKENIKITGKLVLE